MTTATERKKAETEAKATAAEPEPSEQAGAAGEEGGEGDSARCPICQFIEAGECGGVHKVGAGEGLPRAKGLMVDGWTGELQLWGMVGKGHERGWGARHRAGGWGVGGKCVTGLPAGGRPRNPGFRHSHSRDAAAACYVVALCVAR